jgi:hypothetical protein
MQNSVAVLDRLEAETGPGDFMEESRFASPRIECCPLGEIEIDQDGRKVLGWSASRCRRARSFSYITTDGIEVRLYSGRWLYRSLFADMAYAKGAGPWREDRGTGLRRGIVLEGRRALGLS